MMCGLEPTINMASKVASRVYFNLKCDSSTAARSVASKDGIPFNSGAHKVFRMRGIPTLFTQSAILKT